MDFVIYTSIHSGIWFFDVALLDHSDLLYVITVKLTIEA